MYSGHFGAKQITALKEKCFVCKLWPVHGMKLFKKERVAIGYLCTYLHLFNEIHIADSDWCDIFMLSTSNL